MPRNTGVRPLTSTGQFKRRKPMSTHISCLGELVDLLVLNFLNSEVIMCLQQYIEEQIMGNSEDFRRKKNRQMISFEFTRSNNLKSNM